MAAREGRRLLPRRRLGGARRLHRDRARATRFRGSTSRGAPAPASSRRSRRRSKRARRRVASRSSPATGSPTLRSADGAVTGAAGDILAPSGAARGMATSREVVGVVRDQRRGDDRLLGRHRRQPRPRPQAVARASRHAAGVDDLRACPPTSTASMLAVAEDGGCAADQRRPDVALRRGHPELGSGVAAPRHPHPSRAVVGVARRDRHSGCRCRCSPASTRSARSRTCGTTGHDHSWFVLSQQIIEKEFTLSGSEQNPDLTGQGRAAAGQDRASARGPAARCRRSWTRAWTSSCATRSTSSSRG